MGANPSKPGAPGGRGAVVRYPTYRARRACMSMRRREDERAFALGEIYGVPDSLLDQYPPHVYSLKQATEDIAACRRGARLPHGDRVVRFDRVARGQDPRVYALMAYHGYRRSDFRDPRVLELLPYSKKDAQVDIARFHRTGKPYYTVIRLTSTVIDPKRGTIRDWRFKGYENRYKYDMRDPDASKQRVRVLGDRTGKRFDASKYPLQRWGGQWVRIVPCSELPAMCSPGQKTFPYPDDTGGGRPDAYQNARNAKLRLRRNAVEHSRRMDALSRQMAGLNRTSEQYAALAAQKVQLRAARRGARAGAGGAKKKAGGWRKAPPTTQRAPMGRPANIAPAA